MAEALELRGVRVHNLKNLDLILPHHCLIVITGPSGSGKSSLAFDTIHTEGQRRYTESLNPYVRQFLERMEKPDLDYAAGITPTIAVGRTPPPRSSRSTVATMTEVADVFRLLYSRLGTVLCQGCGEPVEPDQVSQVAELLRADLDAGLSPLMVSTPLPAAGSQEEAIARLRTLLQEGYLRISSSEGIVRLDSSDLELEVVARQMRDATSVIERPLLVIDRLMPSVPRSRIREAVEGAYREGGGIAVIDRPDGRRLFTEGYLCSSCLREAPQPRPQLFSFNSPYGACPACEGFGSLIVYLPDLVVPDPTRSLEKGAVEPWTKPAYQRWQKRLLEAAAEEGIRVDLPWEEMESSHQDLVWKGFRGFKGVDGFFERLEKKKYKVQVRVFLARYRSYVTCSECGGTRLRSEARGVVLGGEDLGTLLSRTISDARQWLGSLKLSGERKKIYAPILEEAESRLKYLEEVGVGYLTLDRLSRTLSGGEAQRIALASVIGAALVDTTYILDEPSVGLHPMDAGRLIRIVKHLRDIGNTVIVVEHDRDFIESADMVVDMGPEGGRRGGRIVYQGALHGLLTEADTATSRYLQGRMGPRRPLRRRQTRHGWLKISGAAEHNLREIDVEIPLELFTCVTGLSGSGKSTLIYDILKPAIEQVLGLEQVRRPGKFTAIDGYEGLRGLESLDQGPLTANRRSNPATYSKAWDGIRNVFAGTEMAKHARLNAGSFSFNIKGGRCPECRGEGSVIVDMQFMADVTLRCEECNGKRFTRKVLDVRYRGKNIADILQFTVDGALQFFNDKRGIVKALQPLQRVGLGYLRLGQPAPILSAGEAQRLKLASHLGRRGGNSKLFLFDEPTTGLHGTEVGKLIDCIEELVEQHHTVVVIEHNMDLVSRADWVIDLGPGGGEDGGSIVAYGRPEDVARTPGSFTGRVLAGTLQRLGIEI